MSGNTITVKYFDGAWVSFICMGGALHCIEDHSGIAGSVFSNCLVDLYPCLFVLSLLLFFSVVRRMSILLEMLALGVYYSSDIL